MKYLLIIFLLCGCQSFHKNHICGGFPNDPKIIYIKNEGELVEAFAKMIFYIDNTEKAKQECKYVD